MKTLLQWITWISGIIGILLLLLATIAAVFRISLFGIEHAVNIFHAATSFLLMSILTLIYKRVNYEN